jgi:hypothetical protein
VDTTSWRTAFALSTLGPLLGLLALRKVPEPRAPSGDVAGSRPRSPEGIA